MKRTALYLVAIVLLANAGMLSAEAAKAAPNCPNPLTFQMFLNAGVKTTPSNMLTFPDQDERWQQTGKYLCNGYVWNFAEYALGFKNTYGNEWLRHDGAWQANALSSIDQQVLSPVFEETDAALAAGKRVSATMESIGKKADKSADFKKKIDEISLIIQKDEANPAQLVAAGMAARNADGSRLPIDGSMRDYYRRIRVVGIRANGVISRLRKGKLSDTITGLSPTPIINGREYKGVADNRAHSVLEADEVKQIAEATEGDGKPVDNNSLLSLFDLDRRDALAKQYEVVSRQFDALRAEIEKLGGYDKYVGGLAQSEKIAEAAEAEVAAKAGQTSAGSDKRPSPHRRRRSGSETVSGIEHQVEHQDGNKTFDNQDQKKGVEGGTDGAVAVPKEVMKQVQAFYDKEGNQIGLRIQQPGGAVFADIDPGQGKVARERTREKVAELMKAGKISMPTAIAAAAQGASLNDVKEVAPVEHPLFNNADLVSAPWGRIDEADKKFKTASEKAADAFSKPKEAEEAALKKLKGIAAVYKRQMEMFQRMNQSDPAVQEDIRKLKATHGPISPNCDPKIAGTKEDGSDWGGPNCDQTQGSLRVAVYKELRGKAISFGGTSEEKVVEAGRDYFKSAYEKAIEYVKIRNVPQETRTAAKAGVASAGAYVERIEKGVDEVFAAIKDKEEKEGEPLANQFASTHPNVAKDTPENRAAARKAWVEAFDSANVAKPSDKEEKFEIPSMNDYSKQLKKK